MRSIYKINLLIRGVIGLIGPWVQTRLPYVFLNLMRYKLGSTIYIYLPENQSVQKMHAPELNEINNSFCQFAATTNSYTYVLTYFYLW